MNTERSVTSKAKKITFSIAVAIMAIILATTLVLTACEPVFADPPMADQTYMTGHDTKPGFEGYYSAQVTEVLESTTLDDKTKAAYLWALASYNYGQADQFAMFQNKVGNTTLDGNIGTLAYQQYYKEKRHDGDYKGEKYHYTIKHVYDSTFSSMVEGLLESARMRIVANTGDLQGLYRFELNGDGKEVTTFTGNKLLGEELLDTVWQVGDDFGGNGEEIWKRTLSGAENNKSVNEVIAAIKNDIQNCNIDDRLIQGNINTLADRVVSDADIEKATDGDYYVITMSFDLDKLNADKRSIEFLNNDNSAKNMKWDELSVSFEIWATGLFKSYTIDEKWTGEVGKAIIWFEGSATSSNHVYFSYTDEDCSMDKELAYLKEFIDNGGAENGALK